MEPVHVYPRTLELDDIVHKPGALVRNYHLEECACCADGRCWQRVEREPLCADVIVHGLNLPN